MNPESKQRRNQTPETAKPRILQPRLRTHCVPPVLLLRVCTVTLRCRVHGSGKSSRCTGGFLYHPNHQGNRAPGASRAVAQHTAERSRSSAGNQCSATMHSWQTPPCCFDAQGVCSRCFEEKLAGSKDVPSGCFAAVNQSIRPGLKATGFTRRFCALCRMHNEPIQIEHIARGGGYLRGSGTTRPSF